MVLKEKLKYLEKNKFNNLREIRFELMISIWKTDVIPLNYTRYIYWLNTLLVIYIFNNNKLYISL